MIEEKKELDCCKNKDLMEQSDGIKKSKGNLNQALLGILGIVAAVNILTMGYFTYSVNDKLNEAIDVTKPQTGELTLVKVDDCPMCGDLAEYKKIISAQNVELTDEEIISNKSDEGKKLIEEFGLKKLPALVFVAEENLKSNIAKALEKDSRKVGANTIIWEKNYPPYLNVGVNNVSGLVDVVYLTDSRCKDCYNPLQIHRPILQNFGVAVLSEKQVDVLDTEGKELVSKYNIQAVPTVILSADAGQYLPLLSVWRQVGTSESDGSLVFREMEALNSTYKDLITEKVIVPVAKIN